MNNSLNQKLLKYQTKYSNTADASKKSLYALKIKYYKSQMQKGGDLSAIIKDKMSDINTAIGKLVPHGDPAGIDPKSQEALKKALGELEQGAQAAQAQYKTLSESYLKTGKEFRTAAKESEARIAAQQGKMAVEGQQVPLDPNLYQETVAKVKADMKFPTDLALEELNAQMYADSIFEDIAAYSANDNDEKFDRMLVSVQEKLKETPAIAEKFKKVPETKATPGSKLDVLLKVMKGEQAAPAAP